MFRQKLTISEHEMAGNLLREAYLSALHAETFLINNYGRRAVITRHARRAVKELLRAKSAGDDQFFKDNPSARIQDTPYFGDHQFLPEAKINV